MAQKQIHFDDLEVKAHSVTISATDGDVLLNRTEAGGAGSVIVSSGSIVAANEDNLVAVNGDGSIKAVSAPDARTALGLGSAATQDSSAFLQPGITSGSGVRSDGTLVPPTLSEIPIITGGGWIGASGKSFGSLGTLDQIIKQRDDTIVPTLAQSFFAWPNAWFCDMAACASTVLTGDAAELNVSTYSCRVTTGTSGSIVKHNSHNQKPLQPGGSLGSLSTARPWTISLRASPENLATTGEMRVSFGKLSADGYGPLSRNALGFLVRKESGNNKLYAIWYNNNSVAEEVFDMGYSVPDTQMLDVRICRVVSDTFAPVYWFVNGTLRYTSPASFPLSNFGSASRIMYEMSNGAEDGPAIGTFLPSTILTAP